MSKLQLSVAVGNYDRVRPLMDGTVQIDGVDPIFMNLPPEEIFFRAFRSMDFDICELSMSSFTVKTAEGTCPYVGVPAFVSRAFRHNSIYVRKDRIKSPADLKGKRNGPPEFQIPACAPAAVFKAFVQAKAKCLEALEDTAASKVTLPFVEEQLRAARELMGEDFWSYGLAANRKVLQTFLCHHHAEGLSSRLVAPEELFH